MSWVFVQSVDDNVASIAVEELHHIRNVLRSRPGETISIVDGHGQRGKAIWTGDSSLQVTTLERLPQPDLHLVLALGSRTTNEESMRRAAEMGVATITPVITARSKSAAKRKQYPVERWQVILRSGCAQSGNPWLPTLHPVSTWAEYLANRSDSIIVCDPSHEDAPDQRADTVVIGPEGGWEADEITDLPKVNLGPFVLRTPVAVAIAITKFSNRWH